MFKRGPLLLVLCLACWHALPADSATVALPIPVNEEAKLDGEAGFLARLLQKNGAVYFRLPADALPSRDAKGQWRKEPLQAALGSQGSLALRGDVDTAAQGSAIQTEALSGEDEGRWLIAAGLPKVLVVEDSSTVPPPPSKGLTAWKFPFQREAYADVEAKPRVALNPALYDAVVFSDPGWWGDFANPPSGPSSMPPAVVDALRDFVRQGGTAVFFDITQWDLEKAWPKTLDLIPLAPYQVSTLKFQPDGPGGGVTLAPVGVATDKLRAPGAFSLLGSAKFTYPDGGERELDAAYAMPDPGGGQGWIVGMALNVFDQDAGLSARVRRLFLNVLLLSGTRRLSTQGEPKEPTPGPASPTRTPDRSPTASPTASDLPTAGPSATSSPTPRPTELPTAVPPTTIPSLPPTAIPTAIPTARATLVPTSLPSATPVPLKVAALRPSAVATAVPAPQAGRPAPTLMPVAVPSPADTPAPAPGLTARPTRQPAPKPLAKLKASHHAPVKVAVTGVGRTAAMVAAPSPTPPVPIKDRPVVELGEGVKNALGCLSSAPEPFAEGGVFLDFCLKHPAHVQVSVFDAQGRPLWKSEALALAAGQQQVFYDGRANGRTLVPGRYLWEVRAHYASGQTESRQAGLSRKRETHSP